MGQLLLPATSLLCQHWALLTAAYVHLVERNVHFAFVARGARHGDLVAKRRVVQLDTPRLSTIRRRAPSALFLTLLRGLRRLLCNGYR